MNEVRARNRRYWASTLTPQTQPMTSAMPSMRDLPEVGAWPDDSDWLGMVEDARTTATLWRRVALVAAVVGCVGWLL